jgi:hypothetical protein
MGIFVLGYVTEQEGVAVGVDGVPVSVEVGVALCTGVRVKVGVGPEGVPVAVGTCGMAVLVGRGPIW